MASSEQTVYTVFAMGLARGELGLQAAPRVDAAPAVLPATGEMLSTLLLAQHILRRALLLSTKQKGAAPGWTRVATTQTAPDAAIQIC
jgi:hypothetical protein